MEDTYGKFYEIKNLRVIDEIGFCSKAMGADYRFMNVLHIEDGILVCTDRKRLHISDTKEILPDTEKRKEILPPDGDYRVLKVARKYAWLAEVIDNDFPKWESVLPKGVPIEIYDFRASKDSDSLAIEYSTLVNKCSGNVPINYNFIIDIAPGLYAFKYWEESKAMLFENSIRRAVIAPFRMDLED